MERSIKERGKLLDEFMMNLLYPPKEIVEKWVLMQNYQNDKENEFQTNLNNYCSNCNINDWTLLFNVTTSKLFEIPT